MNRSKACDIKAFHFTEFLSYLKRVLQGKGRARKEKLIIKINRIMYRLLTLQNIAVR